MYNIDRLHAEALAWFETHAGEIMPWPDALPSGQKLSTLAKGIYKPKGWQHALSIKVVPAGRYPDEEQEPRSSSNSGWRFRYHQEEPRGEDPATYFTNRGLAQCMADDVPVGVLRQSKPKPGALYEIVGLGKVTGWEGQFFIIEGPVTIGEVSSSPEHEQRVASSEDARERVLASITRRRGQPEFRANLLRAYAKRCALSDCSIEAVLEAAHIVPYRGDHTNVTSNGLLLRSDLHTLFDLDLIKIDSVTYEAWLHHTLLQSEYAQFHGRKLRLPPFEADRPVGENFRVREQLLAAE